MAIVARDFINYVVVVQFVYRVLDVAVVFTYGGIESSSNGQVWIFFPEAFD